MCWYLIANSPVTRHLVKRFLPETASPTNEGDRP
jgi:hypothetical protein